MIDDLDRYVVERVAWSYDYDACWPWLLSKGSHGYGQAWTGSNVTTAHRLAWTVVYGDPGQMTVDHLCRNRICCNPFHMRLLTNVENARLNGMAAKTHCLHGHPFDQRNTRIDRRGHRRCIACQQIRNDRRKVAA